MIALISDIHSNIEALEAVLDDIKKMDCETIYCLGDIVGYGPNPTECVDLVMEKSSICTMGNHDFGVVKMPFGFNRFARASIDWTKKILKPGVLSVKKRKVWKWINNLTPTYEEDNILYLHASPLDPIMDYVKESDVEDLGLGVGEKIKEIFGKINFLCFIGHTHKPAVITDTYQYIRPEQLENYTIQLDTTRKYLINIGSVGQPRDKINTSCYVLFNGKDTIQYRRVEYDFEKTIKKIEMIDDIDDRLGERLREGK
jgi:predicted phosphodiesterase